MRFSEKQIRVIVGFLKWFYIITAIVILVGAISGYFLNHNLEFGFIFAILISGIFYIGLRNKKSWIIPLMLFLNAIGVVSFFFIRTESVIEIIAKFFGVAINVFLIYFFSRKEVKEYFNSKGFFLFTI